jgi:hypothetical protein
LISCHSCMIKPVASARIKDNTVIVQILGKFAQIMNVLSIST